MTATAPRRGTSGGQHGVSGVTCFYFGDFAGAHNHFQETIELYDPARHGGFINRFGGDSRAAAEIVDAVTLWVLGQIDEALRLTERALAKKLIIVKPQQATELPRFLPSPAFFSYIINRGFQRRVRS